MKRKNKLIVLFSSFVLMLGISVCAFSSSTEMKGVNAVSNDSNIVTAYDNSIHDGMVNVNYNYYFYYNYMSTPYILSANIRITYFFDLYYDNSDYDSRSRFLSNYLVHFNNIQCRYTFSSGNISSANELTYISTGLETLQDNNRAFTNYYYTKADIKSLFKPMFTYTYTAIDEQREHFRFYFDFRDDSNVLNRCYLDDLSSAFINARYRSTIPSDNLAYGHYFSSDMFSGNVGNITIFSDISEYLSHTDFPLNQVTPEMVDSAYQDGYQDGYENGNNIGTLSGYQDGYNAGYNEGVSQDDVVASIFNGILSVGILPIEFFLRIFNFEILGINLSAFITALLSIGITLFVWRLVKGSKND